MLALPNTALAQNECGALPGAGGLVSCPASGNPYPAGITYLPTAGLTVVLPADVSIQTATPATPGVQMVGAGDLAVDGSGASIATSGALSNGVTVSSLGGSADVGLASVSTTGAGSTAVSALTDTGAASVITTGNVTSTGRGGAGISAVSATGDAFVTANNVSTVAALPADTATSRSAIFAQGANAAVISTGTVTTAGRASLGGVADAISVTGTAGNASAVVNNVAASGDTSRAIAVTASNNASATVNGLVSASGLGADALAVTGGNLALVTVGPNGRLSAADGNLITLTSVNGSTLSNSGTIGSNPNGLAVQALGGPATINNSGSLSSNIVLTAGNDTVNNSGTFVVGPNPDFGAGTDAFVNTGVVSLGAGATVAGASTFTGLESFSNAGLIDLRNGVVGDSLTLPGTFSGTGASQLGVDVRAGGSDRLILGGAATGTTTVLLDTPSLTAPIFTSGAVIVQAGAPSAASAFQFNGGFQNAGLVRYEVAYDPATLSYSVTGGPSDAAFRTLNYVDGARSLWMKSADVVTAQLRSRRDSLWAHGDAANSGKFWLQMHGSVEDRGGRRTVSSFGQSRVINTGYKQDYYGGQAGFDFGGGVGEKGGFAFGVTGGYINSSQNFAASPDRITFNAVNAGVYGSFTSGNIFANVLGKYDHYWANANSPTGGFKQKFNGSVYGVRGEVGLRFGSDAFFIEPAASLSYTRSDIDNFSVLGTTADFNEDDGLRGRIGGRVGGQVHIGDTAVLAPYIGANYVHEFKGRDEVSFSNGVQTVAFTNDRMRDYGEAVLGVTIGQTSGISGFLEANYVRTFSNGGGSNSLEGAGGRAGLRIRF